MSKYFNIGDIVRVRISEAPPAAYEEFGIVDAYSKHNKERVMYKNSDMALRAWHLYYIDPVSCDKY